MPSYRARHQISLSEVVVKLAISGVSYIRANLGHLLGRCLRAVCDYDSSLRSACTPQRNCMINREANTRAKKSFRPKPPKPTSRGSQDLQASLELRCSMSRAIVAKLTRLRRGKLSSIGFWSAVLLSSFLMRLRFLWSPRGGVGLWSPLDPDAITYGYWAQTILKSGIVAYTNVSRVPLWPIALVPFYALLGASDVTIRFASFFFGVLTIFATFKVARSAFSYQTGVLASFLVAASYYVAFDAFRGLREEVFSFLLLCLIYFSLVRRGESALNLGAVSVLTAMLYFTRSDGALLVIPTLLVYFVLSSVMKKEKIPYRKFLLVGSMFVLSIAGWGWYSAKITGDPFQESTTYAMWNYWVEIQGAPAGTVPTVHVTMLEYLFKYHTIPQLLVASALGTYFIVIFLAYLYSPYWFGYPPLRSPLSLVLFPVVPILFLGGAYLLLKAKKNWYFPFLYAVVVPYLGMFHQLGVLETYRALVPFAPILLITISYTMTRIHASISPRLRGLSTVKSLAFYLPLALLLQGFLYINYEFLLAWGNLAYDYLDAIGLYFTAGLCLLWAVLRSFRK